MEHSHTTKWWGEGMKEEPEILRNIAKEQGEKEIGESHIRNRMGYIEGE